MTAQIIRFTEARDAIRLKRAEQEGISFLAAGMYAGLAMFWIFVGVAAVNAWPWIGHGTPPTY